jgi:hypothetical protein
MELNVQQNESQSATIETEEAMEKIIQKEAVQTGSVSCFL